MFYELMDYYDILGISKNASQEEIKKAFHRLAHKHHPHKGGDEKKFKEISEAYQILSDKEKRAQYDQFGRVFEGQTGQAGQGFNGFDFNFNGNDFSDFGINFEDIFGEFFGFGGASPKKKRNFNRGDDLEMGIEIELKEAFSGLNKKIVLNKKTTCSRCQGSGGEPGTKTKECFSCRGTGEVKQIKKTILGAMTRSAVCPECGGGGKIPDKPCNVCKGEGRMDFSEEFEISIPAGVDSGQTLKVNGKGEAGRRGGGPGDLYLKIFVKPHSLFSRKGDDLYINLEISFSQAVLGGKADVPSLDGNNFELKIPAGTESGKVFRISGKGVSRFSGWGSGDLYVKLIIKTPKKLTKKQKELLDELKKEGL